MSVSFKETKGKTAMDAGKSSSEIILDAVREMHGQEQIVTRETLAEFTGLTMTKVDDLIGVLIENGLVVRVQRGVFVPAVQFPPARPISKTILPDGWVKIEIGDELLTLTPRESRMLGELSSGAGQQMAAIELGHQATQGIAELLAKCHALQRRLAALEAPNDGQGSLGI